MQTLAAAVAATVPEDRSANVRLDGALAHVTRVVAAQTASRRLRLVRALPQTDQVPPTTPAQL